VEMHTTATKRRLYYAFPSFNLRTREKFYGSIPNEEGDFLPASKM